jgi:hypothetical protein
MKWKLEADGFFNFLITFILICYMKVVFSAIIFIGIYLFVIIV